MSEERSFVVARGQDVLEHAAPIARKLGEILDSLEPFLRILYDVRSCHPLVYLDSSRCSFCEVWFVVMSLSVF